MKKLNQNGISILEGLISSGLAVMTIYVSVSMYNVYNRQENNIELTTTIFQLRQNLIALVSNQDSWDKSVVLNSTDGITSISCLIPPVPTGDPPPYSGFTPRRCRNLLDTADAITLYDPTGDVMFSAAPTAGFTKHGQPCNGFSSTGNDSCPINVKIGWTAACSDPDPATSECVNTQSLISVTFTYMPKSTMNQLAFNAASFSFKDQPRIVLSAKDTPMTACARSGQFYLPVLPPEFIDSGAPGPEGCVPFSIFDNPA